MALVGIELETLVSESDDIYTTTLKLKFDLSVVLFMV